MTKGELIARLSQYPDTAEVGILFETTDKRGKMNHQYMVGILDLAGPDSKRVVYLCHEADYDGHYSKGGGDELGRPRQA